MAPTESYWNEQTLAADEVLWSQGDPADELVRVISGRLRVEAEGREMIGVGPGQFLGELSVFMEGWSRMASVVAEEPTVIQRLHRDVVVTLRDSGDAQYDRILDAALRELTLHTQAELARLPRPLCAVPSPPDLVLPSELRTLAPGEVLASAGARGEELVRVVEGSLIAGPGEPVPETVYPGDLWGLDVVVCPRDWRVDLVAGDEGAKVQVLTRSDWQGQESEEWRAVASVLMGLMHSLLDWANGRETVMRSSRGT